MLHADFLFLLTDVDGLYTSNPRKDPSAKLLEVVESVSVIRSQGKHFVEIVFYSISCIPVSTTTLGSSLGTGGMETKLIAADIATAAGVTTIILSSNKPENISAIIQYHNRNATRTPVQPESLVTPATPISSPESTNPSRSASPTCMVRPPHTVFKASLTPMRDLKSWTTHTLFPSGSVIIDAGAHLVLSRRESGGRLLAAGAIGVIGAFASGQAVRIVVRKQPDGTLSGDTDITAVKAAEYVKGIETPRPTSPSSHPGPVDSLTPTSSGALVVESMTSPKPLVPPSEDESDVVLVERELDADVVEVGRGLANYNSAQILRVKGLKRLVRSQSLFCRDIELYLNSSELSQVLGYADSEYLVENITIRVPPT